MSAPADPVIRTWAKVFPGIFVPLDSMPKDFQAHIRYPDELYTVQANLYTTYHMEAPEDFYHREDQWQIPSSPSRRPRCRSCGTSSCGSRRKPGRNSSTWCRSPRGEGQSRGLDGGAE